MNTHSTKFRLTTLIVGSLTLLSLGIGLFSTSNISEALNRMMRAAGRSAVMLSANNVRSHYEEFFNLKVESAERVKRELLTLEDRIRAIAEEEDFLRILDRFTLLPGMSVWVLDEDLRPVFVKGGMDERHSPYAREDIKGRDVGSNMLRLARLGVTANALVQFPPEANGGGKHFGHHFHLASRKLLVGLWTDIAPHEAAQERKLGEIVGSMRTHLQKVRLGQSGFVFIVDAAGGLVIPPESFALSPAENLPVDEAFLGAVRAAAGRPDEPLPVLLRGSGEGAAQQALVYSEYIKPLGWYVAGVGFVDEINAPGHTLSVYLAFGTLVATSLLCLVALFIIGKLTTPLTQLTAFARRLPGTDFFGERENDEILLRLSAPGRGDEVGELSRALLFMDGALRQRVRELVEAAGAQERIAGELLAATDIQMGFLPKALDERVVRGRFELAWSLVPAREVGGDLYDFFMVDEDRLCLVIGDVSDKGVPAALFMSMTMVLIRSAAGLADGPEAIMRRVNENLARENRNGMFVTLFIAFLDLRTGELTFSNGGHNPPLLRSGGELRPLEDLSGPIVGVFEGAEYTLFSTSMRPGDQLFLYTDGLTEAMNAGGDMFGDEALARVLAESPAAGSAVDPADPGELLDAVRSAVAAHVEGAPASDDLTMLFLSYREKTCTPDA